MVTYYARFEPDREKGGFVVTFPDVSGCITQGSDEAEATAMAADALSLLLAHHIGRGDELPPARARRGGLYRAITLPPLEGAKVELYQRFRASGLRKSELARRMGIPKTSIERLFDLEHASRLDQLEAAFRALGKRIVLTVEDAA